MNSNERDRHIAMGLASYDQGVACLREVIAALNNDELANGIIAVRDDDFSNLSPTVISACVGICFAQELVKRMAPESEE